jgi:hypothetical protein
MCGGLAAMAVLLLVGGVGEVRATSTFLPAPARTDAVHDVARNMVYIADGTRLLRFSTAQDAFVAPVEFGDGTALAGIDMSADGRTLAVADVAHGETTGWVHLVDLDSLDVVRSEYALEGGEGGSWSVAFAADGALLSTARYLGSGWVPLRRRDPTGAWGALDSVRGGTMLAASGDRETIAFAESNSSSGPWGIYDVPTGQVVSRDWEDGTSWFNYEIAVDALGGQFVLPTYGGAYVYDAAFELQGILGAYAGAQPVGAAFHPTRRELYLPWATTDEIHVYDPDTLEFLYGIDVEGGFEHPGNWSYQSGRIRMSPSGDLLLVTVAGGVRIVWLERLEAGDVHVTTRGRRAGFFGTPVHIDLPGTHPSGAPLAFRLASRPRLGVATLTGGRLAYAPLGGRFGTETIAYEVRLGDEVATGTITIDVR